jgi:hypothetical protein
MGPCISCMGSFGCFGGAYCLQCFCGACLLSSLLYCTVGLRAQVWVQPCRQAPACLMCSAVLLLVSASALVQQSALSAVLVTFCADRAKPCRCNSFGAHKCASAGAPQSVVVAQVVPASPWSVVYAVDASAHADDASAHVLLFG